MTMDRCCFDVGPTSKTMTPTLDQLWLDSCVVVANLPFVPVVFLKVIRLHHNVLYSIC